MPGRRRDPSFFSPTSSLVKGYTRDTQSKGYAIKLLRPVCVEEKGEAEKGHPAFPVPILWRFNFIWCTQSYDGYHIQFVYLYGGEQCKRDDCTI